MSDWMQSDDIRKTVVVQSLKSRSRDLRTAATKFRKAYTRDYMNIPMNWLADAFDEAAAVLETALSSAEHREPTDALGQTASEVYSAEVLDAMTRAPKED